MKIERLVILGVGLIGGSLALALRRADVCNRIIGFGRNEKNLGKAVELGVIDEFSMNAGQAVLGADLVVLATPLSSSELIFREISGCIGQETVITDVGSAKQCVVKAAQRSLGNNFSNFVPGHPVAGKEKSGVEAATADLFEGHLAILTPVSETGVHAISTVTRMWEAALAEVVTLQVEHHDKVLAATSHLPHMLAYALVDCLARLQESDEIFQFAAGGFADFTRIASSNPHMWHDICFANKQALLDVMDTFDGHLQQVRNAIENDNKDELLELFSRAKTARDDFIAKGQTGPGSD